MPKADIGGLHIHYTQVGSGPDIVMVHGLAANLAFWYLRIVPALARKFRVTIYDLRGHGFSDMPPHGYTCSDMARDLDALMRHTGIRQAHLVGHSFGGSVILRCALDHPEKALSLTLADPVILSLYSLPVQRAWRRGAQMRKRLGQWGVSLPQEALENAHVLLDELADPKWRGANGRAKPPSANKPAAKPPAFIPFQVWGGTSRAAERWRQLLRTTTALGEISQDGDPSRDEIQQLKIPTLVIYGQFSRYLPTLKELKRRLPHCKTVIVPGVGHFHPAVKPDDFVHSISEFLSHFDGNGRAELPADL